MRIAMIGAGNVATVLGIRAQQAGHELVQVISRTREHAARLANRLGCRYSDELADLDKTAQLVLVAVSDGALYELSGRIHLGDKLVVHTAGSVSRDVLKEMSAHYGVLYPLQTLRIEKEDYGQGIPLLVDGNSDYARERIREFASGISSLVSEADDEQRLKLHLAGVVASNFTTHL